MSKRIRLVMATDGTQRSGSSFGTKVSTNAKLSLRAINTGVHTQIHHKHKHTHTHTHSRGSREVRQPMIDQLNMENTGRMRNDFNFHLIMHWEKTVPL